MKIDEGLKKKMEVLCVTMEVLWEKEEEETKCGHVMWGKTKKFLTTVWDLTLFVQHTQFLWLNWSASKSPKFLEQNFENFF